MHTQRVVVYFMTGTGNSGRVAAWAAERARAASAEAAAIPIEIANPAAEVPGETGGLVGLVMPTHAFTAPWRALRFAWRLPRCRGARAFCIATRAGLKFGPVFTPGLSGTGPALVALVLRLRGYRIAGLDAVDMPSNWTACHPGLGEAAARAIVARARPRVDAFMDGILNAGRMRLPGRVTIDTALGILLAPVSLAYLVAGRFLLARLFFASNRCNGCGLVRRRVPSARSA